MRKIVCIAMILAPAPCTGPGPVAVAGPSIPGYVVPPTAASRIFDFTKFVVPIGITASRAGADGGPMYPCLDASQRMGTAVNSGMIFEWRDARLPPGMWSFKGYSNGIPNPFNFASPAWDGSNNGWYTFAVANYVAATPVTSARGPDGLSPVYRLTTHITEPSVNYAYFSLNTTPWTAHPGATSVWIRDTVDNPPAIGFLSGSFPFQVGQWTRKEFGRDPLNPAQVVRAVNNRWRRLGNMSASGPPSGTGALSGSTAFLIVPSSKHGLDPWPYPNVGPITDGTSGDIEVAGASMTCDPDASFVHSLTDLPLVTGSTGATSITMTTPSQLVVRGELDVSISFIPGWQDVLAYRSNSDYDAYLIYAQTSEGELSARIIFDYVVSSTHYIAAALRVRGVDVIITLPVDEAHMVTDSQHEETLHIWYKPVTTHTAGMRWEVDGGSQPAIIASTTGGPLQAPTSVTFLQNQNATKPWPIDAMLTRVEIPPYKTSVGETNVQGMGVLLGDSLLTSSPTTRMSQPIWYAGEIRSGAHRRFAVLSQGGKKCEDMQSRFAASIYSGNSRVSWIADNCGVNNIILGDSSATLIAKMQTEISAIKASNPNVKYVRLLIAPFYQYALDNFGSTTANTMEVIRQAVNTAIMDGTITGIDGRVFQHLPGLTDIDGKSMKCQFDNLCGNNASSGKGLHYNAFADAVIQEELRRVLIAKGF